MCGFSWASPSVQLDVASSCASGPLCILVSAVFQLIRFYSWDCLTITLCIAMDKADTFNEQAAKADAFIVCVSILNECLDFPGWHTTAMSIYEVGVLRWSFNFFTSFDC